MWGAMGVFLPVVAMVLLAIVGCWSSVAWGWHQHKPTVGILQIYLPNPFLLVSKLFRLV
jgi:hypothetical protein